MEREKELLERLTAFYRQEGAEAPSSPPVWTIENRRQTGWLHPVLASAALAALVIAAVVGVRTFRPQASRVTVKPTATVLSSASATPSATLSPTPLPPALSSWITRRIPLGSPVYTGMAIDSSAVFALYTPTSTYPRDTSQVSLARIDRTTGRVVTNGPFPGGFQLVRVRAGLWVVGGMSGQPGGKYWIDLVDPVTLQVKARSWVSGQPSPQFALPRLTGTPSLLWLAYGSQISRLDPATGKILTSITVVGIATSASLDPSERRLYVGIEPVSSSNNQAQVIELDALTGVRRASAWTGGLGLGGPTVAASTDGVWIAYATGMMGQVEHRSAADLSLIPNASQTEHSNGIYVVVGGGSVWYLDGGAQQLACVDPRTGAIAASTDLGPLTALVADSKGTYAAVPDEVDFLQTNSCPHS